MSSVITNDTRSQPSTTRPLSDAQSGLWYAQRLDPSNPVFNTGQYADITGYLDVDAFRRAVNTAVSEADTLAVRIDDTADGPRQTVDEGRRPWLQVIDFTGTPDAVQMARDWMRRDMTSAVDPSTTAVAIEVLFVLGATHYFWYQRIHHVAIDGYGTALLNSRICDLYQAFSTGAEPHSAPFGSFDAVLDYESDYQSSEAFERDRQFWLQHLEGCDDVVGLTSGDATSSTSYLTEAVDLPPDFGVKLEARCRAASTQWPDALTTLVVAYLCRHTRTNGMTVGVPSMQRLGTPAARVPAMVMNVLPVAIEPDEDVGLDDLFQHAARTLRLARRHGRYRSERLRRDLGRFGQRRLHGPLVNVLPFDTLTALPGLSASLHVLGTGPVDDLTVTVRAEAAANDMRIELDGNPRLYNDVALQAHARRLRAFLVRALDAPSLANVSTLTGEEHVRWTTDVNATEHRVEDTTLTELIERSFRRSPDARAVVADEGEWTYADLDRESASMARTLESRGVRRGDIVAVALPRSRDLVLSLVSILRAGAAYLPLDPGNPPDRIALMIDSARPRVVLCNADTVTLGPASTPALRVDQLPSVRPDRALPTSAPDDAAYVIYTSGSTGAPKGVVIQHRAIVNRLDWMRTHYGITPADRILLKTPATFDVSVWEFFLPLVTGATLVVSPEGAHKDPHALAALIRKHAITTMHFVPSMLAVFLAEPSARDIVMTRVFASGEELPAALRDRFHEIVQAELHNLYGPTEAAVDVTYWPASASDTSVPVPIGFPVWNTQMYVLDARLRPLPPETPGDLYIAGVQLAREYLGRPDLTNERFVPNPFGPVGSRMYKTGDLARWREDGAIVFLGRTDHQVKIRGLRIELGEIETAIRREDAIADVAVIARADRTGDQRLVAYLVVKTGRFDESALRSTLATRLPDYMIPSAFVELPSLPLSRNGKLDRAALPEPSFVGAQRGRSLNSDTERELSDIIRGVLGLPSDAPLGADADFFALGGHSLLAARLVAHVRGRWSCDLGLGVVFAHPTIERLANQIDQATADSDRSGVIGQGLDPMVVLSATRTARPALFAIHPAGGISWCYGHLARALGDRTVYGLQARGLDPDEALPDRLADIAADYVDRIRNIQPDGPYHLAGWSVGGILAHEIAVELRARDAGVGVVAMFDSYPCDRWRGEAAPDERAALRALLYIAGHDGEALGQETITRASVIAFLRRSGHPLGELSDAALTGVVRVVGNNSRLVRQHLHRPFDGSILYFRAALDHAGENLSPTEWLPYVRALESHDVPSLHAHLTGPDATNVIAPILRESLRRLDTTS